MLKQFIVYIQINSSAQYTLGYVRFSKLYRKILQGASVFGLDIASILDSMCVEADHFDRLRTNTLLPLALVGLIGIWFVVLGRRAGESERERIKRKAASATLMLSCLIMTNTATIIFRTFDCDSDFKLENGEDVDSKYVDSAFLESDYRVSCHSARYKLHRIFAIEMCFVFPVGIPLVYLSNLISHLNDINPKEPRVLALEAIQGGGRWGAESALPQQLRDVLPHEERPKRRILSVRSFSHGTTKLRRLAHLYLEVEELITTMPEDARNHASQWLRRLADELIAEHRLHNRHCAYLSFLFRAYLPEKWYMEVIESARRLILTCMLPSIYPDKTIGRVYVAAILVLAFALGYEYLRPFADPDTARFATAMHVLLLTSLFLTIVLYTERNMVQRYRAQFDRRLLDGALISISVFVAPMITIYFLSLKIRKLRLSETFGSRIVSRIIDRGRSEIIPSQNNEDMNPLTKSGATIEDAEPGSNFKHDGMIELREAFCAPNNDISSTASGQSENCISASSKRLAITTAPPSNSAQSNSSAIQSAPAKIGVCTMSVPTPAAQILAATTAVSATITRYNDHQDSSWLRMATP